MRAALCRTLDGPQAVTIEEIAAPAGPGPGEVLIAVRLAALNFLDTLITCGRYQFKPDLPFSPAAEVVGEVLAAGAGVTGFAPGRRVAAYIGWGGARGQVIARESQIVAVPDGVADAAAAGVNVTYGTAMHALIDRAHLKAGETVAVLGASGGAGLAAVEVAGQLGARVIAAASSADKLAVCRAAGAHELVDYTQCDLKETLRGLTDGRGVDVIYDCVGGSLSEPALRAMAWQGRFLVVGFAGGEIPRIPLNLTLLKGCEIVGVFWGEAVRRTPERHRAAMERVLGWIGKGALEPRVHAIYPLDRIGEAIAELDQRKATGKVLVDVRA